MLRRAAVLIVLLSLATDGTLAAEKCEVLRNEPIMYSYPACRDKSQRLNFWVSDLSLLTQPEQPEYSASCRKENSVFQPQPCFSISRDAADYVVIVHNFAAKEHFCNYTLPGTKKDNIIKNLRAELRVAGKNELRWLMMPSPRAFDYYFVELEPLGEALVKCNPRGVSCELTAVTADGQHLLEIAFPKEALPNWQVLLKKAQDVVSRCQ